MPAVHQNASKPVSGIRAGMDALALLALPPQAAAVQIERSASEVQHLATGYINRLEIEPVGH